MVNLSGMHKFDDQAIATAYANYVQSCYNQTYDDNINNESDLELSSNIALSYDEFREYYFLNLLGKGSDFLDNIARDYQNKTGSGGDMPRSI